MLECYEAYADYMDIAARCEQLVAYVAAEVGYAGEHRLHAAVAARDAARARSATRTGIDILALRDRESLAAAMRAAGSPCRRTTPGRSSSTSCSQSTSSRR